MRNKQFRLVYKGTPLGPTYDSAERALEALKRLSHCINNLGWMRVRS